MEVLKNISYFLNYVNFFILYLVIFKDFYFIAGALLAPFTFSIVFIYAAHHSHKMNFDMLSGIFNFWFSLTVSLLALISIIDITTFIYLQAFLFIILVVDTIF